MGYWKLYALYKCIVNNFLLTEREVCTEKYRTKVFFVQTKPVGQALYKKTVLQCFSVHTQQARLTKSLSYGIYRHLIIYTWNKQEMQVIQKHVIRDM